MRQKIGLFLGLFLFFLILFLPPPQGMGTVAKSTAACALLMAIFWITESIPIPATALIPLVLFPFLKVMPAKSVATSYANHNIFLFMGGFFIAMAMQRWNLHKRIALHIIKIMGTSPKRLVLGFMVATAFLSMWISNTATTMMMFPIGLAVVMHIKGDKEIESNFGTGLMLGIAYSASIGGIGTLVGTPPNIVFAGAVRTIFPDAPEVGFFQWLKVGIPVVVIFLPIVWFYLVRISCPIRIKGVETGKEVIEEQLKSMGRMSRGESWTLIVFCLTALGWVFRRNINLGIFVIPGWSELLGIEKYVHDSTVAIFGALLLFIIPVNFKKREFVLNWEWAKKIPWGIILLFGGGFALAAGFQSSGLDKWIGSQLGGLTGMPILLIIISICLLMTFLTELTSNTATTTMMMPVLASMALAMKSHPFLLMIPATISASCAFMLPVATPPNAIVFGSGYLTIPKMAKVGLVLNFVGVVIVTLIVYTLAIPAFGITSQLPPWVH